MTFIRELGSQVEQFYEKIGGKKSRRTVPLSIPAIILFPSQEKSDVDWPENARFGKSTPGICFLHKMNPSTQ